MTNLRTKIVYGLCLIMALSFSGCTIKSTDADDSDSASKIEYDETLLDRNADSNSPEEATESEDPTPADIPAEPSETASETSQSDFDISDTYDTSQCDDFQIAYADFMKKAWEIEKTGGEEIESYSIYDIDKDGVPELLIKYGNCEAAFHTVVYSYSGDNVEKIGEFISGHSVLYTWPDENGIMIFMGQMSYEYVTHATISDKSFNEAVISDKQVQEYSNPQDFKNGSVIIDEYYTKTTLPIYLYNTELKPCGSVTFTENPAVRDAFIDVLNNKISFYAYSLDSIGNANGPMLMDRFLSAGSISSFGKDDYSLLKYSYLDVNGDGQAELLLQLGTSDTMDVLAILSFDDDTVYCYYTVYAENNDFLQNGVILNKYDEKYQKAVAFYKSEGYTYYVDISYSNNIPPVEWSNIDDLIKY